MRKILMILAMVCSIFVMSVFSGCTSDGPEKITLEEFNKITSGMTYDEVKAIIGSDGTKLSESGESGSENYTVIYTWKGVGDTGANANFTFQNEKLLNKAQAGLK